MKTLIKYLILAMLVMCLSMPREALAQRRKVTISGGHSRPSSKPKPKTKPESKPKPRSEHKPSSDPTPSPKPTPAPEDQTFIVNGVTFIMIWVQGGTFTMGATSEQRGVAESDENPAHQVTLSSFSIGQTEVTQELWEAVMGGNPSYWKGPKLPIEEVSWIDCQTFITKLNELTGKHFRLPTEAEWEYAARGGSKSQGYKYSGSNNIGNVAWYDGDSGGKTHDVATKQPNELGIYDMSGNVWEWCSDWFGSYSSFLPTNPQGPSSGSFRTLRGGCWNGSDRCCRVANRNGKDFGFRNCDLGFRLALNSTQDTPASRVERAFNNEAAP